MNGFSLDRRGLFFIGLFVVVISLFLAYGWLGLTGNLPSQRPTPMPKVRCDITKFLESKGVSGIKVKINDGISQTFQIDGQLVDVACDGDIVLNSIAAAARAKASCPISNRVAIPDSEKWELAGIGPVTCNDGVFKPVNHAPATPTSTPLPIVPPTLIPTSTAVPTATPPATPLPQRCQLAQLDPSQPSKAYILPSDPPYLFNGRLYQCQADGSFLFVGNAAPTPTP